MFGSLPTFSWKHLPKPFLETTWLTPWDSAISEIACYRRFLPGEHCGKRHIWRSVWGAAARCSRGTRNRVWGVRARRHGGRGGAWRIWWNPWKSRSRRSAKLGLEDASRGSKTEWAECKRVRARAEHSKNIKTQPYSKTDLENNHLSNVSYIYKNTII